MPVHALVLLVGTLVLPVGALVLPVGALVLLVHALVLPVGALVYANKFHIDQGDINFDSIEPLIMSIGAFIMSPVCPQNRE